MRLPWRWSAKRFLASAADSIPLRKSSLDFNLLLLAGRRPMFYTIAPQLY